MKRKGLLAVLMMVAMATHAQQLLEDSFDRLVVQFTAPQLQVEWRQFDGQEAAHLVMEEYASGGQVGAPALPVLSQMIEIPFCENIGVRVVEATFDTLQAPAAMLWPLQMPRSKSDSVGPAAEMDTAIYAADAYFGMPLASVRPLGTARDRRLAALAFSPVRVNPVAGKVIVCHSATVEFSYVGADREQTVAHYRRYFTPSFAPAKTLNSLFSSKEIPQAKPVRMAIVLGGLQGVEESASLQRFVEWKRRQGMLVDVIVASQYWTPEGIADTLRRMYDHATELLPAPTYVVLVGDHQQLAAEDSRLSDDNTVVAQDGVNQHKTDHYYTTWTSDNLPDAYIGRLSAEDTASLTTIIDKTLLYEQYAFADDSYLGKAAIVSGVDASTVDDAAYTYCDPSMDYIVMHYVNGDHGYPDVTYFKNNTGHRPDNINVTGSSQSFSTAGVLRNKYNEGMGLINYSAHGYATSWYKPAFTKSNANEMSNLGKPSVVVANCCLSSQFYNTTCLGEAMLRRGDNAGAVVYIGGVDLTYWIPDFYMTVGVRDQIYNQMSLNYDAANIGMYDRLFHTHGESEELHAATTGEMLHAGLMAVNSAAASGDWYPDMADYYWEVYELLGDPSLIPWLGRASATPFSTIRLEQCHLVRTAPYAYVALVDTATLEPLFVGYADAWGEVCLPADEATLERCHYSVSAAGYKPLFVSPGMLAVRDLQEVEATVAPNPAHGRCLVAAEGLWQVELTDMTGRMVLRTAAQGRADLDLGPLKGGVYVLRLYTDRGTAAKKLIVE